MIMAAQGTNGDQFFFSVWTFGRIEVNFEYLKKGMPFRDEASRRELLDRLNALPGVQITDDKLTKRPSISFDLLRDAEVLNGFLAAMEWTATTIRQGEQVPPPDL